jgi:hypothetical protein
MTRQEYLEHAFEALNSGRVTTEVYDCMLMNIDVFCDDDEEEVE